LSRKSRREIVGALKAWLYLDRMDLSRYWPENAGISWDDFIVRFRDGKTSIEDCAFLDPRQKEPFRIALEAQNYLPEIPSIDVPQPIAPELFALNEPDENSPVIVTGNSQLTFDVLATIWAQGTIPAYFLLVDCGGNTVDMAMVFEKFTPDSLLDALEKSGIKDKVSHRKLLVPGLTSSVVVDFKKATGWDVEAGPVCAAEIPLFLTANA